MHRSDSSSSSSSSSCVCHALICIWPLADWALEILLEECLLWSQQIGWKKKTSLERSRLLGSSRSSSFGALYSKLTLQSFVMVLSRWNQPTRLHSTPLHPPCTLTNAATYIYIYICMDASKRASRLVNISGSLAEIHNKFKRSRGGHRLMS